MEGMSKLGFEPLLPKDLQAPIIITFRMPGKPSFDFQVFYKLVKKKGYVLYPGKLTVTPSFRVGCIGHLGPDDMKKTLDVIKKVLTEMETDPAYPS